MSVTRILRMSDKETKIVVMGRIIGLETEISPSVLYCKVGYGMVYI